MSIHTLLSTAATHSTLTVPAGWGQGRATYGGLIAGLLVARLLHELNQTSGTKRQLRSASISFIGAVTPGEIEIRTEFFRSGKSVTQAEARLIQHGQVQTVLLASFGSARDSVIDVAQYPAVPSYTRPADLNSFPYIPTITPEFFQQVDTRYAVGARPFSSSEKPDFGGWMRWKDHFEVMSTAHLVALIDAWPPSVLPMFTTVAPASTMCWTVEILASPESKHSDAWWQYRVQTDHAKDGYAHAEAHIWNDDGLLVAISRQTSTVFM